MNARDAGEPGRSGQPPSAEPSVTELQQVAKLFNMSVDDILNY